MVVDLKLNVANMEKDVTLLGPGRRNVLWVQGCCFACPGCIGGSYHSLENGGQLLDTEYLSELLSENLEEIEGITISGGEPFLQAKALLELIEKLKKKKALGIIVYSGFTMEELKEREKKEPEIGKLLGMIDVLIDGRYEKDRDEGDALRGSANQRIWKLTQRYSDEVLKENYEHRNRKSLIKIKKNQAVMIGVPDKDGLKRWKNVKSYLKEMEENKS